MKKFGKRFVAFCCIAALAATCTVGASAGSISGTVNGIGWTGTTISYGVTYFTCSTTIGRSASYGDMKQVQAQYTMLNGFHKDPMQTSYSTAENSITYECFHTPSMGDQHAYHGVNIDGKGQSGTSWA